MSIESLILRCALRLGLWKPAAIDPPAYERKRAIISAFLQQYDLSTAIETGTFLGDTTAFLAENCKTVISIELAETLAQNAVERFANNPNVTIIHGDSAVALPKILEADPGPKLFWLDGHYSGVCGEKSSPIVTAKGSTDTPIVGELEAILVDPASHVILIDDARLFNGVSDYPSIREIRRMVKKSRHFYRVSVEEDIIRIAPTPPTTS